MILKFRKSIRTKHLGLLRNINYNLQNNIHAAFSAKLSTKIQSDENSPLDSRKLLKFNTLHELQINSNKIFSSNPLFGTFTTSSINDGGKYNWMSYSEFGEKVAKCRTVLRNLGVEKFSKIGIIANNRWEWAAIAMASYSLSATLVPMYEAQLPKDWQYILNDSECVAVFSATQEIFENIRTILPSCPTVKASLCLDAPLGEPHAFSTAMESSSNESTVILPPLPEDLANLIYTSGTTGRPKGVELTHSNFASNVKGIDGMVHDPHSLVNSSDRSLSFLPWAHSYGQTCELWKLMSAGASLGLCRGFTHILDDLQLVKPTMIFSVPTLFKRVYEGVNNTIENSSPLKQRLMRKALELGRFNTSGDLSLIESFQFRALDGIVLQKIRDRFGGNLRIGFVAGAACPAEILQFMDDIGIMICEGYGLTETSPIIAINSPDYRRIGTVGRGITGVQVIIADEEGNILETGMEGEICCYGPNVMRGYYKRPDATDEVISLAPDGNSRLFHTGDLGKMDEDGYISITGRLKELYKLENGKYVCPTPIEEALSMSRFISQVVLCGANREYNVALLVPDWNTVCGELKLHESVEEEEILNDVNFKQLIDEEINDCSKKAKLKKYEIPTKWAVVAPFTAANNMLTPKLSIRRHKVIKFYEDVIEAMYDDAPPAPHEAADPRTHLELPEKKAA